MAFRLQILGREAVLCVDRSPPVDTGDAIIRLLRTTRPLRSSTHSADWLSKGATNLILGLPRESRRNENAGLITVVLVLLRLIEDDSNAMETEIRSVKIKLHRKQPPSYSN
jgi:hypothetical protein